MNPYLDEELVALGGHVRRFATSRGAPGYLERDSTRVLDRGLVREMGAMGTPRAHAGRAAVPA